jgi:hypothetical protein
MMGGGGLHALHLTNGTPGGGEAADQLVGSHEPAAQLIAVDLYYSNIHRCCTLHPESA